MKKFFVLAAVIVFFAKCDSWQNQHEAKKDSRKNQAEIDSKEQWGNISESEAKELVQSFCDYSDSLKDFNSTKSVWFKKADFKESLNKIFDFDNQSDTTQYDGFRMYFARYPGNWKDSTKRFRNTMVITKTRQIGRLEDDVHEDIIESDKGEIYVQPLNDGGRCRPNCGGTKLLNAIYQQERTH